MQGVPFYKCRKCDPISVQLIQEIDRSSDSTCLLPCMYCDSVFYSPVLRDEHMYYKHDNDNIVFTNYSVFCNVCGIRFACIHGKESHFCMAIYTSVCTVCNAKFDDKLGLWYHKRECYHKEKITKPPIDI